jgi:hypothetical protein
LNDFKVRKCLRFLYFYVRIRPGKKSTGTDSIHPQTLLCTFFLKSHTSYTACKPIPYLHALFYNYLCTYDLYGPARNVFDAGGWITWGRGGGWRWKSRVLWAPVNSTSRYFSKMARPPTCMIAWRASGLDMSCWTLGFCICCSSCGIIPEILTPHNPFISRCGPVGWNQCCGSGSFLTPGSGIQGDGYKK